MSCWAWGIALCAWLLVAFVVSVGLGTHIDREERRRRPPRASDRKVPRGW